MTNEQDQSPQVSTATEQEAVLPTPKVIIENLTNLDELTGKELTVYALPIKLNVDGAPARVIAEVK